MEAEPLVCSRCHAEVIGGWADGRGGLVCAACVARAARRSRALGYLEQIHATLGHGQPWDDCAVCSTTYEEAARSDG
jgi:hypothetical protein